MSVLLKNGEYKLLKSLHFVDKLDEKNIYRFVPAKNGGKVYLKIALQDNQFMVLAKDEDLIEDEIVLQNKLEELLLMLDPAEASLGTEQNEVESEDDTTPYDPEKIRVDTKSFSLRQIYDMMESEDIDLAPDFQRNLVWDEVRKCRLMESILLRIPLPMFYFVQDEEGKISVVDGLQRLSAIHDFMNNKFALNHLEYLQDKCKGKYYSNKNKKSVLNTLPALDAKYFRWFNMTQITVHVIDPSSPFNLKYDIFRRINTGGQPLNPQEIRNCLSSAGLRTALKKMSQLESFRTATGSSIKNIRMESQEMALRFMLFYRKYKTDKTLNNYNGNIDGELNTLTDSFSKNKAFNYQPYITLFDNAMKNAHYLFGEYCFRKVLPHHLEPGVKRQLINKALFASWSVLLCHYKVEDIQAKNERGCLAMPLAKKIKTEEDLFIKLTYGTNAKLNNQVIFKAIEELINQFLNQ